EDEIVVVAEAAAHVVLAGAAADDVIAAAAEDEIAAAAARDIEAHAGDGAAVDEVAARAADDDEEAVVRRVRDHRVGQRHGVAARAVEQVELLDVGDAAELGGGDGPGGSQPQDIDEAAEGGG